jgi:uncharacterized membrane protein
MTPLPKLFIGYALIIFLSLLPVIITMVGAGFDGGSPGPTASDAIIWLAMFTIPLGVIVFIAWTIYWAIKIRKTK